MLQDAGYVTGVIGKWGLGGPGDSGEPNRQGFDHWYGYLCQREAHNYYPTHLWRDGKKEALPGNPYFRAHQRLPETADPYDPTSYASYRGQTYSMDVLLEDAENFIRRHADRPFFLYLPFPVPHAALQVPDASVQAYLGAFEETPYTGDRGYLPHPTPRAAYAAMITRMDSGIGRLLSLLVALGIADRTVVMFTSDNGPTFNGGTDSEFFESTAGLRGLKTSLYEGGIRVPLIVRWPGRVEPGSESDRRSAFWDYLPTLAEIAGVDPAEAAGSDGLSLVPALTGDEEVRSSHHPLYWEYHGAQAILDGRWKAIRTAPDAPLQLYDLESDPMESQDVASAHPGRVEQLEASMERARTPSDFFPLDRAAADRLGRVRRACGLVSAAVRSSLGASPDTPVHPGGPGAPRPACEVRIPSEPVETPSAGQPLHAVGSAFESAGWSLDPTSVADGAGTGAFAWTKEDVRCEVAGGWPASVASGGVVRDDAVFLEARCFVPEAAL
jgi:arylsulfatase A-like enzyme